MTTHTDRDAFNQAVINELESRDRPEVAAMSDDFDRGMSALSAADVAHEEGLDPDPDDTHAIERVADAREYWYDEIESQ